MINLKLLQRFIRSKFNVPKEEDNFTTYQEISEGANFKGYNLWILSFAMIIACVGLNVNSLSAIIGAMLISPLMGPVIGFGFAMAINDKQLKKNSFRNWIVMTLVSIISATVYFLITPFDENTDLLESFKKASIFDILIAFFGGLAGFIGIIKKEGTKILAGVAIATACMPPLCTMAYGLAHFDYKFLIGGFYFYFINCLFIGLATFLLARYFRYHLDANLQKLTSSAKWLWYLFIIAMLLPGVYIAHKKWKFQKNKESVLSDKQKIEKLEKRLNQTDSTLQLYINSNKAD